MLVKINFDSGTRHESLLVEKESKTHTHSRNRGGKFVLYLDRLKRSDDKGIIYMMMSKQKKKAHTFN